MKILWSIVVILSNLSSRFVCCLDNGLARTPPMGWLSWTRFTCNTNCVTDRDNCISEKLFMDMADQMVADGYRDAGYEYVSLDDCWLAESRDKDGRLQADPLRFPSGITGLVKYMHSRGLKLGIYEDFGTRTCAGYPGSEFYMQLDAETFADWQVDLLKFDGCNSNPQDDKFGYPAMSFYLNKTGRPILFSCEWPLYEFQKQMPSNYTNIAKTCNVWRNFWDVSDSWDSIKGIIKYYGDNNALFQAHSGPGGFFDPDMIVLGDFGLSYYQQRVQMTMWAMWSAPLVMSNDLRNIRPESKALLLNKRLLEIDQDPMGVMASRIWIFSDLELWLKPVMPKGSFVFVYFYSQDNGNGIPLSTPLDGIGLTDPNGYNITEVIDGQHMGIFKPSDTFKCHIYPNDVFVAKAVPLSGAFWARSKVADWSFLEKRIKDLKLF
ncbi:hypothetical protein ACJMK2_031826 [Sinanodonta woodiana]|uniref:Alpha-galactosidase n=1 Tax=Sinanodonta woodiana TaxID=1069815 RepID=A0ABD3X3E0_SINWO